MYMDMVGAHSNTTSITMLEAPHDSQRLEKGRLALDTVSSAPMCLLDTPGLRIHTVLCWRCDELDALAVRGANHGDSIDTRVCCRLDDHLSPVEPV